MKDYLGRHLRAVILALQFLTTLPTPTPTPTPTTADARSSGSAGYAKTSTHTPGVTLTDATVRGLGAMPPPSNDGSTSPAGQRPTQSTTAVCPPDSSNG